MEEVIRRQFSLFFEKILPSTQFGFREGLSTIHAVGAARHDWLKAKQGGLQCGALFFDLSAAFDMLDVDLLEKKMEVYGAGKSVLKWVRQYLTGRRQVVDFGGEQSREVEVTVGSPQGSIISPLLFLIMVADLEEWLSSGSALSYADDTTVYAMAATKEKVREMLETSAKEVLNFMAAAKLAANESKTKFVMFGRTGETAIRVGASMIEESKEETLLGITSSKTLSWKAHLDIVERDLRKRIGLLRRLSWQLPPGIVSSMVQPIFTAKLMYGLPLLAGDASALSRLHSLHRMAMKAALRMTHRKHPSDDELYRLTGQISIQEMALAAVGNMSSKCIRHWREHPLTATRIEEHVGTKRTRQATSRSFPPQSIPDSILNTLVETWEVLPLNIRSAETEAGRKRAVKIWARSFKGSSAQR